MAENKGPAPGDITATPDLLEGQQADAVLADHPYDSNGLRENRSPAWRPGSNPIQAKS
ncbi:hypothetical protein [Mesorhizobium sp. M1348]|uniref:hypothetical protein n=1 Tax=Mesorhizobium sp. M1348 TaxID=2957089 RepID=UPI0033390B1A